MPLAGHASEPQERREPFERLRRLGLRAKFNLALVPIVATAVVVMVYADYRHEFTAVMEAHGIHPLRAARVPLLIPVDAQTTPDAVVRRTLILHAVAGIATLAVLVVAINLTLSRLVLIPLVRIRSGLERLEHGQAVGLVGGANSDELGEVVEAFGQVGLMLDALMHHIMRTEQLATLALVSKTLASAVEPEVEQIGIAVTRLQRTQDHTVSEDAHVVAVAAARILGAVRGLDRPFLNNAKRRS